MNETNLSPFLNDSKGLPRSTTLLKESGLRIMLLHLNATESIPEHHATGAITVQCLTGEVSFYAGEDEAQLIAGKLISLPPGQPHRLTARRESLLLVTLSEQAIVKTRKGE